MTAAKQKSRRRTPPIPPPLEPRYEGETWRPNAPGWPAQPHIPAQRRKDEER